MTLNILNLGSAELKTLEKHSEVLTFTRDFVFIYEGQIPLTGLVLIEGTVELKKRSAHVSTLAPGSFLGLNQLLRNKKLGYECVIKKDSKVLLPGKSTLVKLIREKILAAVI